MRAGATPYIAVHEYHQKTGVQFNYQPIGSGGGIKQMTEGTVDFGASDAPLSDAQLAEAKEKRGTDIVHLPTVMGAVVATYNVSGVGPFLKLTPEALAGIYLGQITTWNDPKIASVNPGFNLPNTPIVVVHRSDGSGTTNIFTDYLCKVSPEWQSKVGKGTSVNWPVGLGAKGNEGVSGQVKQVDGSIGYVEHAYAFQNKLPYAEIRNKSGVFVKPSIEGVTAAAAGAAKAMPADFRIMITDAPGKDAYPICGFTWLLMYHDQKDQAKAQALAKFLRWAYTDGEKYAAGLLYAPLPPNVVKMVLKKIDTLRYNGKPIR